MNTIFAAAVVVWGALDTANFDLGILKIALLAMAPGIRGPRGAFSEAAKLPAGT